MYNKPSEKMIKFVFQVAKWLNGEMKKKTKWNQNKIRQKIGRVLNANKKEEPS